MKKILCSLIMAVVMLFGVVVMPAAEVSAEDGVVQRYDASCSGNVAFFGLKPWYYGLTTRANGACEIGVPRENGIPLFVWTIVLNILYDLSVLVGYIAIIMVAFGGFLYMFSRGLPDRAERGKKTLIAAFAGLAIAMLASVIMNTIVAILTGA